MFFKNVASQGVYVFAKDTSAQTPKTGDAANISVYVSKDGAAAVESNTTSTGTVTEIGGGLYWCALTQAETNADIIGIYSSSTTSNVVLDAIEIATTAGSIPKAAYGGSGGLGTVDASNRVAGIAGTANTLDDLNDPTAAAVADAVFDEALSGHTSAGTAGERLGRIPNAAAGGNGGLPTVDASNHIAGIAGTVNTLDGLNDPTAASIADAVFDEALSGHTSAGTAGERMGRIPNAAAGGNGGLPTVDANNRIAGIAGTVVNTLDEIAGAAYVEGTHALDQVASTADINAEVDTALADIGLDHLLAAAVTGPDVANNSIVAKLVSASATADWDDFNNTTDSLQANRDNQQPAANAAMVALNLDHLFTVAITTGDVTDNSFAAKVTSASATANYASFNNTTDSLEAIAGVAGGGSSTYPRTMIDTTLATVGSQVSMTLTAGSDDDNAYTDCLALFTDSVDANQKSARRVTAYTGSSKTITLESAPAFVVASGDAVIIVAEDNVPLSSGVVSTIVDGVMEDDVSSRTTADSAGKAIDTLTAVGARTNNADLNAMIGVPDTAGVTAYRNMYFVRDYKCLKDDAASRDEYGATWAKDDGTLATGVTTPTIQVVNADTQVDLIAETSMTDAGSNRFIYNATGDERMTAGQRYLVIFRATIDSSQREDVFWEGRDTTSS